MPLATLIWSWIERVLIDGLHRWLNSTDSLALWLSAAATVLLAVAAIVALRSLKDAKRTRHGTLVTDLSRRWDEPLLISSLDLYARLTEPEIMELVEKVYITESATSEERAKLVTLSAVPTLLETIGVLVEEEVIDAEVVYKLWGDTIIGQWESWEHPVGRIRDSDHHRPWSYEHFADLAKTMRKLEAAQWRKHRAARHSDAGSASPRGGAAAGRTAHRSSLPPSGRLRGVPDTTNPTPRVKRSLCARLVAVVLSAILRDAWNAYKES